MSARSKGQIAAVVAIITASGASLIFKLAPRPAGQTPADRGAEGSSGAAAGEMTIASFGGAYQTSQQNAYFKPFAKGHGVKINEEEYNGEIARIKAMVDAKNVSWDVVDINMMTALAGCDQGIFETLDWSRIGDRSRWLPSSATDCAAATIVYSTILAYDTDKLSPGPTTIADLFDVRRFPGKRGLQKDPFVPSRIGSGGFGALVPRWDGGF
jgi:putative spermidine/putrescine transport system substrate-binding protein